MVNQVVNHGQSIISPFSSFREAWLRGHLGVPLRLVEVIIKPWEDISPAVKMGGATWFSMVQPTENLGDENLGDVLEGWNGMELE